MEELLGKYFAGEADDTERNEVHDWRERSADNALLFVEYKSAWIDSGEVPIADSRILEDILKSDSYQDSTPKVVAWPSFMKYAAAIILVGMISSLWYFNQADEAQELAVFNGEAQTLPDGTRITLKNGASLDAVEFSDSERRVFISGKAFFEVARDEEVPFFVVTDDATIRVLGTSFQVNEEADFTEVCVESGLVEFSTNEPGKNNMSVNLKPGEMGVIGNKLQGIVKHKNDNQNFLAWKDGALSFERTNSTEVVKILEDVYGIQFDLPENLKDCRLTAKFKQKSLEEVIQIISVTFNWSYEINKGKVVLSGEGC